MKDNSANSISPVAISEPKTNSLEPSPNDSQARVDFSSSLLPRSAWNSRVAFLRALFRAKRALDKLEKTP